MAQCLRLYGGTRKLRSVGCVRYQYYKSKDELNEMKKPLYASKQRNPPV